MTAKQCSICKQIKSLSEYNKNCKKKDGLQTICRKCSQKKSKKYYSDNTTSHKQNTSERKNRYKEENKQRMYEYFLTHHCVDCGEKDIRCLEFDHVRGEKKNNISSMMKNVCSWKVILEEISKCEVRCANCHRKRTSDIQSWYKSS